MQRNPGTIDYFDPTWSYNSSESEIENVYRDFTVRSELSLFHKVSKLSGIYTANMPGFIFREFHLS